MRSATVLVVAFGVLAACATPTPRQQPLPERPPEQPVEPVEPLFDPEEAAYETISLAVSVGDPMAAIEAYEAARLQNPDSPDTQVLLANLYLAAGDIEQAETILRDVLARVPEFVPALYALSLIEGAAGNRDVQESLLGTILGLEPDHAEARAALGEIQLRNRRYTAAAASFEAALEDEPESIVALMGLANVQLRTDEFERAEQVLTEAIEVAPEYSFAWADRSRARALQLELDEAESDLTEAVRLDPDFYWHHYDRGLVRLQMNDFTGAIEDFSRAIDIDPTVFLAFVYRARALDGLERRDAAVEDYQTALDLRPDYRPAYSSLAVLLFERGEFERAGDLFARAWRSTPENDPREPGQVLLSALSYKFAGNEARARSFLEVEMSRLSRPSLFWDMARYYLTPNFDGRIFRDVQDESDRLRRLRMQFYLAGQYEVRGRLESARALYEAIEADELRGYIERRLALHRLAQLRLEQHGLEQHGLQQHGGNE